MQYATVCSGQWCALWLAEANIATHTSGVTVTHWTLHTFLSHLCVSHVHQCRTCKPIQNSNLVQLLNSSLGVLWKVRTTTNRSNKYVSWSNLMDKHIFLGCHLSKMVKLYVVTSCQKSLVTLNYPSVCIWSYKLY